MLGREGKSAFLAFLALLAGYLLYAQFLGPLTDENPLEDDFAVAMATGAGDALPAAAETDIALNRAFPTERRAKLQQWPCLQIPDKSGKKPPPGRGHGTFVWSGEPVFRQDDPTLVELAPIAFVNIAGDPAGAPSADQIVIAEGAKGVLRFDRPVENYSKLGSAKLLGAWVEGDVSLVSNNRTPDPGDDYTVRTQRLDYRETVRPGGVVERTIFSDREVALVGPDIPLAKGKGLEIELPPANAPANPVQGPKRRLSVRTLRLLKDIDFLLAGSSGADVFAGAGGPKPNQPAGAAKTQVRVTAAGPFEFHAESNLATFHKRVQVLRPHPGKNVEPDQLDCDRLRLHFAESLPDPKAPKGKPGAAALRVSLVEAEGKPVNIVAPSEELSATCDLLTHDAATGKTMLSVVRPPLVALVRDARVEGKALTITRIAATGTTPPSQLLEVLGPNGRFLNYPKGHKPGTPPELSASFARLLTVAPGEAPGEQRVRFEGSVELESTAQGALKAEDVRIRLAEVPDPARPGAKKLEPTWLEATGRVSAFGKDFAAYAQNKLTVAFLPALPDAPATIVEAPLAPASANVAVAPAPALANGAKPAPETPRPGPAAPPAIAAPSEPMELRAETVDVQLRRRGAKNELVGAEANGTVFVRRADPSLKEEDRFEAKGNKLRAERGAKGDILRLFGGAGQLAEIRHARFKLDGTGAGQEVIFDEARNWLEVAGPARLTMAQASRLVAAVGDKPAPPSAPFTVEWTERMEFDGQNPLFRGAVKAWQVEGPSARVIDAGEMQVTLSQRLEFVRGRKPAKGPERVEIANVVCSRGPAKPVRVDVMEYFPPQVAGGDAALQRHTVLVADNARLDNRAQRLEADGPRGSLTIVEAARAPGAALAPGKAPLFRTEAMFEGRFTFAQDTRRADFFEGVRFRRGPVATLEGQLPERQLGPDDARVDCNRATLEERPAAPGKPAAAKQRVFRAYDNVRVTSAAGVGTGDEATYDQTTNMVALAGRDGKRVSFARFGPDGKRQREMELKAFEYNAKTGEGTVQEALQLDGLEFRGSQPAGRPLR